MMLSLTQTMRSASDSAMRSLTAFTYQNRLISESILSLRLPSPWTSWTTGRPIIRASSANSKRCNSVVAFGASPSVRIVPIWRSAPKREAERDRLPELLGRAVDFPIGNMHDGQEIDRPPTYDQLDELAELQITALVDADEQHRDIVRMTLIHKPDVRFDSADLRPARVDRMQHGDAVNHRTCPGP